MSPTHQDLSNDTTFSQIKSCVPVPLNIKIPQIRRDPDGFSYSVRTGSAVWYLLYYLLQYPRHPFCGLIG